MKTLLNSLVAEVAPAAEINADYGFRAIHLSRRIKGRKRPLFCLSRLSTSGTET
ncbi:hypothetical protein [Hylemonella gracilis]|uniref:hypothetical protein n=1 Tax=Hylemonella gracilis TaxID=80880 RepID=UPI0012DF7403|nr:hypothetical protein [Hylemonella gracilis]